MAKPWQSRPPRGAAVDLPEVWSLAAGPDPGTTPRAHTADDRLLVHYSRPRLHLDRDGWEALRSPDDVLVQRIRPRSAEPFTIAITRAELDRVFGDVRLTRSWDDDRCYHFPDLPPAVEAFRVGQHGEPAPGAPPPNQAGETSRSLPRRIQVRARASDERTLIEGGSEESAWVRSWAVRVDGRAESDAYLASVAAWRDAWQPEQVRVLLVAESHVAEKPGDIGVSVALPAWAQRDLPDSYCRLVYCLGYGEPSLCTPSPDTNPGTCQFWDIFGAVAGGRQPKQPRKSSSTLHERLRWKLDVLSWLQRHGVWLVDACIAGVYRPGGERAVSGNDYTKMVRESFHRFVWPRVSNEPLQQKWVIGYGVSRALAGHEGLRGAKTIAQPQGDRGDPGRHRRELDEMVASLRRLVPPRP